MDAETYSCEASLPALRAALQGGARVVFCSSKTRAEIEALLAILGLRLPFIVENGGAVFIPERYFPFELEDLRREGAFHVLVLGTAYPELVRTLARVREERRLRLRGFAEMTEEEVALQSGLPLEDARRAKQRQFDEPFLLEGGGASAVATLSEALAARGLLLTRGGRFFHVTGNHDKGAAVARLNRLFCRAHSEVVSFAIGDSINDLPMLRAVDHPILVQKPRGGYDETVLALLPEVARAVGIGPSGWAGAVTGIMRGVSP
ncbi:MAG: HAD hydrolase family protein [Acidobacteria bacterium]|nr:HAD hydrolase family protein [Acidobacteriota bacterium]